MTLRVALSGAGMIADYHLRAWRKLDVELVAIADPDRQRAAARCAEFGIGRHYASLDDLLDAERIDALDILSPRSVHTEQVLAAARYGVPVLCQKPVAPTLEEGEKLLSAVAGRIRVMVHENWRFRPYYRQLGEWVHQGRLGRITGCSVLVHGAGMVPDANGSRPALVRQPFFLAEQRLLIAETLIHHIDVTRWLLGDLHLLAARRSRTVADIPGETAATLVMETTGGAAVVIDGNMVCAGLPPRSCDRFEINGNEGTALLEGGVLTLFGPAPEAHTYVQDIAYQASFDGAIGHFLKSLLADTTFETNLKDNLETLRLVEAAYKGPL